MKPVDDACALSLVGRYYRGYPATAHLGHAEEELRLPVKETALLLVDVYGLGFDPETSGPASPTLLLWPLFELQKKIVCEKIRPVRDAAERTNIPIIYVENYSPAIADNCSQFGKLCTRAEYGESTTIEEEYRADSPALAYSDVIAPPPHSFRVKKQMYDGFFETHLDSLLRNLGIKNLICVGFSAEICLLCTMIGGMYRNYKMVLLRDCTLGTEYPDTLEDLRMTNFSIRFVERLVGYSSTATDFVQACEASRTR